MQINSTQNHNSQSFKGVHIQRSSKPNLITIAIKDTGKGEDNLVKFVDSSGEETEVVRSQTAARLVNLVRKFGDKLRNNQEISRMKILTNALINENIKPSLDRAKTPSGKSVAEKIAETGVDLSKVVQEGTPGFLSKKTTRYSTFSFEYLLQ